jgi:hypothetical protein
MKQFEFEQAKNKERGPECTAGLLNWNPVFDQIDVNPEAHTQSIFPRAFKAHQEDRISFWVRNSEQFMTHPISEPFT